MLSLRRLGNTLPAKSYGRQIKSRQKQKPLVQSNKIALCCIAKDEAPYIEEWVKYHLALGFDKIVIYNNDDDSSVMRKKLQGYINTNKVKMMDLRGQYKQLVAYMHFVGTFKQEFGYVAILDVDEFLVLKKHDKIQGLINEYFKKNVGSLAVNLHFFGNNKQVRHVNRPVLERFTKRARKLMPVVKSIYRISAIGNTVNPHNANLLPGYISIDSERRQVKGPANPRGKDNIVHVNHYISKSDEECMRRSKRGHALPYGNRGRNFCGRKEWSQVEDRHALEFYQRHLASRV